MINDKPHRITNEFELGEYFGHCRTMLQSGAIMVKAELSPSGDYVRRTTALAHIWYKQIAEETGANYADIEAECKLLGLRIIARDCEVTKEFFGKAFEGRSKAEMVQIMKAFTATIGVLRKGAMTNAQRKEYLNSMVMLWSKRGIVLSSSTDKELMEWAANARN